MMALRDSPFNILWILLEPPKKNTEWSRSAGHKNGEKQKGCPDNNRGNRLYWGETGASAICRALGAMEKPSIKRFSQLKKGRGRDMGGSEADGNKKGSSSNKNGKELRKEASVDP